MSRLVLSDAGGDVGGGEGGGAAGAVDWLSLTSPERFLASIEPAIASGAAGGGVSERVPIDELNGVALDAYVLGRRPPARRRAFGQALRAADNLLAAWVLARAAIVARVPDAVVTLTLRSYDCYELDGLLRDLVAAADAGLRRAQLRTTLDGRRREWYAARPSPGVAALAARRMSRSLVPLDQAFPRALGALTGTRR